MAQSKVLCKRTKTRVFIGKKGHEVRCKHRVAKMARAAASPSEALLALLAGDGTHGLGGLQACLHRLTIDPAQQRATGADGMNEEMKKLAI